MEEEDICHKHNCKFWCADALGCADVFRLKDIRVKDKPKENKGKKNKRTTNTPLKIEDGGKSWKQQKYCNQQQKEKRVMYVAEVDKWKNEENYLKY